MSTITWHPGLTIPASVDDVIDYDFNFRHWLEGDVISAATVDGEGLTVELRGLTETSVRVRVSAAEPNSALRLAITTATGQRQTYSTFFNPQRPPCAASC